MTTLKKAREAFRRAYFAHCPDPDDPHFKTLQDFFNDPYAELEEAQSEESALKALYTLMDAIEDSGGQTAVTDAAYAVLSQYVSSKALRPGLERALEIVDSEPWLDGMGYQYSASWIASRILSRLRSELDPEKEIGWKDWPVGAWGTVLDQKGRGPFDAHRYTPDKFMVHIPPYEYAFNADEMESWTILSIDNQTEGGDV